MVASLWYVTHEGRELADGQLSLGKRTRRINGSGSDCSPKRRKREVQATTDNETYCGIEVEKDVFEFQYPLRVDVVST